MPLLQEPGSRRLPLLRLNFFEKNSIEAFSNHPRRCLEHRRNVGLRRLTNGIRTK